MCIAVSGLSKNKTLYSGYISQELMKDYINDFIYCMSLLGTVSLL